MLNKTSQHRRPIIFLAIILAILSIDCLIFKDFLTSIQPSGDEVALKGASYKPTAEWLILGFSQYFIAYPEYTLPFTNFIRPVVNFTYYLFQWDESGAWQLAIVNYFTHGLIAALLYTEAKKGIAGSESASAFLAIGFLAPAFWDSIMPIAPSFAFDGVAAALCLMSIISIESNHIGRGLLFLAIAAATKESAIPIAAGVAIYSLLEKEKKLFLGALAIIATWLTLRQIAFGSILGGVYVYGNSNGILSAATKILQTPLLAPFGYSTVFNDSDLMIRGKHTGQHIFQIASITILAVISFSFYKQQKENHSEPSFRLVGICALLSVLYFSAIGGESRFGYTQFCVLALLISKIKPSRARAFVVAAIIFGSAFIGYKHTSKTLSEIGTFRRLYENQSALLEAIKRAPPNTQSTFIIGDIYSGYVAGEYIGRAARSTAPVYRGSSIDTTHCSSADQMNIVHQVSKIGKILTVTSKIPECAKFTFEGAERALIARFLNDGVLERNASISYKFPEIRANGSDVNFGSTQITAISGGSALIWDQKSQSWTAAN